MTAEHTTSATPANLVDRRTAVTGLLSLAATAAVPSWAFAQTRVAARIGDVPKNHPLAPAIKYARKGYTALDQLKDYTGTFRKRELIDGRLSNVMMQFKVREKPFSVYLKFVQPHAGREVLYVDGANDGKLLAHEGGVKSIAGTFAFDPKSDRAMQGNRYPITLFGMRHLLRLTIEQWLVDATLGQGTVKYFSSVKVAGTDCKVIESTQPKKVEGSTFHVTRLFLDGKTNLPVRVQQYGFPKSGDEKMLVEDYAYVNLKKNVGLTAADFDSKNAEYAF